MALLWKLTTADGKNRRQILDWKAIDDIILNCKLPSDDAKYAKKYEISKSHVCNIRCGRSHLSRRIKLGEKL